MSTAYHEPRHHEHHKAGTNAQTCLNLHTSARTRTRTHTYTHTHAHTYTHACTHAHAHAHTHARTCTDTRKHALSGTCTHAHSCTHVRTHAYLGTHARTQACTHSSVLIQHFYQGDMLFHRLACVHIRHMCVAQNHRYSAIFGTLIPAELDRSNLPTLFFARELCAQYLACPPNPMPKLLWHGGVLADTAAEI